MIRTILATALACALLTPAAQAQDSLFEEDLQKVQALILKGRFSRAKSLVEDILDSREEELPEDRPSADLVRRAELELLRIDFIHGRYREVEQKLRAVPVKFVGRSEKVLMARVQVRTGHYDKAKSLLESLAKAEPLDLEARFRLGAVLQETGQREAAKKVFEAAIAAGEPKADKLSGEELGWLARCFLGLGGRDNIQGASQLLVRAIKAAPERPEARTALGLLEARVYGQAARYRSGEKHFKKVLENNGDYEDALLAMFQTRRTNMFLDWGRTSGYLERCLSRNPNCVPAIVEEAKGAIGNRRFDAAVRNLDRALRINKNDKYALAHRAAVAYLRKENADYEGFRKRALAIDPGFADMDRILGDHLSSLYRFKDSKAFFRRALDSDPDLVPALHGLAKAMVYTAAGEEARKLLERAKKLEPGFVSPWRSNVLATEKLLASDYEVVQHGNFVFYLHKEDRPVLENYFRKWHMEAYEKLGKKYGYKPEGKIRIEVFHEWQDFSVRTIGFRGFSALGACFGNLITLVSPVDNVLRRQDFMWSATVWHEYAHVLHLAVSRNRVPRWLTEGMAVFEERTKNGAWERGMTRDLLDAYHNGDIAPVRLLNRLFRGSRILFGYYQGGLIVEYLTEKHGFDKVVAMLAAYGDDQGTSAIFKDLFGIGTREFDRRFKQWCWDTKLKKLKIVPRSSDKAIGKLRTRLAGNPKDLDTHLALAWAYIQRNNPIDAGSHLRLVLRANPDHPEGNLVHAELLVRRGRQAEAGKAYQKGFKGGADAFMARLNYAGLLERGGKSDEAYEQYQFAKRCWPRCTDQGLSPSLRIARLLRRVGKEDEAMMEMKSFCSMTARAFKPRLDLAAYEHKLKNYKSEVRYLEEAVQIDPFMLSLHERLGDAYALIDKKAEAVEEYRVALAVPPALDRSRLQPARGAGQAGRRGAQRPPAQEPDPAKDQEVRARICVKAAKLSRALKESEKAHEWLDRAVREGPETDSADEARELKAEWK